MTDITYLEVILAMNHKEWLRTLFGMEWQEWDKNEMKDSGKRKWDGRSDSKIVISFN